MQYYVSATALAGGRGTQQSPFCTISQAASLAVAGDEVVVLPGIYRERVNPVHSGTQQQPIVYRAASPGTVVLTGAEPVKNWEHYAGTVWVARIPNGLFGSYNPYTTLIAGDWYYGGGQLHTGEVYLDGVSMYETDSLEAVMSDWRYQQSWFPQDSAYKWYTLQEGDHTLLYANFQEAQPNQCQVEINVRRNCFYPEKTGVDYITVCGFVLRQAATQWAPPTAYQEGAIGPHWSKGWIIEDCEVSDSKCCGISLGKYLQPNNENKWSVGRLKHGTQTERDSICQAQLEGWSKETIGSHIVRRCHIHHCEQAGIVGHLGCIFSTIEDNHIHHINTKQQLVGAEIAGIKLHAPIDVMLRRNHIHHCLRGLWLDWQAQGTQVSQNLFHHNMPPDSLAFQSGNAVGEDLFIEVSHGPTLVDNNLFLSTYAGRISTQGTAYVHNLICGPFVKVGEGTNNGNCPNTPRYTPYHLPHRTEVAGFMTILHGDARFFNNIFVQRPVSEKHCELLAQANWVLNQTVGTQPYDGYPTAEQYFARFWETGDVGGAENRSKYYDRLPVYTGGNVFFNGAEPCDTEENFAKDTQHRVLVQLVEEQGGYKLKTNLYEYLPSLATPFVSTTTLGEAFEPEQKFENPDGSELFIDYDFFGNHRTVCPSPGPFEAGPEMSGSIHLTFTAGSMEQEGKRK